MSLRPEEAIRARALAHSGTSALIGTRWFPDMAPQAGAYPMVACMVSGKHTNSLAGPSGWYTGEAKIGIWAASYESAQAVAEQLRFALNSVRGDITVSGDTANVTTILAEEAPATEPPTDGGEKPIFGILQTYKISMAQATS